MLCHLGPSDNEFLNWVHIVEISFHQWLKICHHPFHDGFWVHRNCQQGNIVHDGLCSLEWFPHIQQVIKCSFQCFPFITTNHGIVCALEICGTLKSCEVLNRICSHQIVSEFIEVIEGSREWEFVKICHQSSHHRHSGINIFRIKEFHQSHKEIGRCLHVILISASSDHIIPQFSTLSTSCSLTGRGNECTPTTIIISDVIQ